MTHDEIIYNLFAEYSKVSKRNVVGLFLSSLSSRKLLWRIGLPIIAIMKTFPLHLFHSHGEEMSSDISPCQVCGNFEKLYETEEEVNDFLDGGGLLTHSLCDYYFGLKAINQIATSTPQKIDVVIFRDIISCISQSSGTIRMVEKKIKSIPNFKSNAEERRLLLETLGYCGILCPTKHSSPYTGYVCLNNAPRSRYSSDWNYPADLWTGSDGINYVALNFWFEDYMILP